MSKVNSNLKIKIMTGNIQNLLWIPSAFPFFAFGFFYYLITPYMAFNYFEDFSVVKTAEKFISSSYFDTRYLADCLLILLSWTFGYFIVGKMKPKRAMIDRFSNFKLAPTILGFLLLFFLFFLLISSMMKGLVFFSGYASYDVGILGQLATVVFMSAWFINYFQKRYVTYFFIAIFLLSSIILIGFGSRMFFVLATITLILGYLSANKRKLFSPSLILISSGLFFSVIFIGIWRSGTELSSETLMFIFFAEPLFTSISGAIYIDNMNGRPFLSFPTDIFASVINFIPTIIFPEKLELINLLTYNEAKSSPFGASSIIVNMYSNFGILFPIYFFMIGFFYGYLNKLAKFSIFYRAVYFSLLPLLMLHFFREGFITVIKVMFFNGFILPAIIVLFLYLLFVKKPRTI